MTPLEKSSGFLTLSLPSSKHLLYFVEDSQFFESRCWVRKFYPVSIELIVTQLSFLSLLQSLLQLLSLTYHRRISLLCFNFEANSLQGLQRHITQNGIHT